MASSRVIPSMTPPEVHEYLKYLGICWRKQGVAMELGCWLGASSAPLLEGLVVAQYDKPFWAFDYWKADVNQTQKAAIQGEKLTKGQNTMSVYLRNVISVYQDVNATKGALPETLKEFDNEPIEICIFDAPKKNPVFIDCMKRLEPHFIPGVTIVGLLDYYSYEKHTGQRAYNLLAPVQFIEDNPESFKLIKHWPGLCSCAFFAYEKPVSWGKRK